MHGFSALSEVGDEAESRSRSVISGWSTSQVTCQIAKVTLTGRPSIPRNGPC